jgi:hypothetical protein
VALQKMKPIFKIGFIFLRGLTLRFHRPRKHNLLSMQSAVPVSSPESKKRARGDCGDRVHEEGFAVKRQTQEDCDVSAATLTVVPEPAARPAPSVLTIPSPNPVLVFTDYSNDNSKIVEWLVSIGVVCVVCRLSSGGWKSIKNTLDKHKPAAVFVVLSHSANLRTTNAFSVKDADGEVHCLSDADLISGFECAKYRSIECVLFVGAYTHIVAESLTNKIKQLGTSIGLASLDEVGWRLQRVLCRVFLSRLQEHFTIPGAVEEANTMSGLKRDFLFSKTVRLYPAGMFEASQMKKGGFLCGHHSCVARGKPKRTLQQLIEEVEGGLEVSGAGAGSGSHEAPDCAATSDRDVHIVTVVPGVVYECV